MSPRRVVELHRQLAELHRELANALVEGDNFADSNAPPAPPWRAPPRRPVEPPDDLTRARARAQLDRLGVRRP
ncbi:MULTISPECIES: hypothetical protein [Sorangium]|uniref:Uncharacterized protein n=1 Tax=Sorangium cellulosum TaxID=56 RepID=A0A4P2QKB3_SORCE|nr:MULTISPECIES: hypothetical protein [Sorangium]AUX30477.1 uncharacterized protein SOCE836_025830 [Sorangium cellulosum]WCQ89871.1 hypothetical protein NQZ70_02569 [Sorangium sp. Soce836]